MAEAYLSARGGDGEAAGRYGIYTLLDMHQDVYNKSFRGEGAPDWAVCTDGVPIVPTGGRWSNNYSNPQLDTAVHHFWTNDVVGNLQGQFDLVWATVASHFKNDPWVVGYDPYNEPFSTETRRRRSPRSPATWSASTPGNAHTGFLANGASPLGLPGRRPEQRCHPVDSGRGPPPPDLRRTGHLLGDRGQRPLSARAHAVPADRLQLPRSTAATAARSPAIRPICCSCLQSEETAASEQDITRLSMSSQNQPRARPSS